MTFFQIHTLQNVITTASKRALNKLKIMEKIKDEIEKINVSYSGIITRKSALIPPWTALININTKMNSLQKNYTSPHTYRQYFCQIRDISKDYTEIYNLIMELVQQ